MVQKLLVAMCVGLLSGSVMAQEQEGPSTEQVLGAIAGGALGSTIGSGDGRKAATVLGAIIGYRNGDRLLGNNNNNFRNHDHYNNRVYRLNQYDYVREQCRNHLPMAYERDWNLKQAWLNGCVERVNRELRAQRQRELEQRRMLERDAYEDGFYGPTN
jgi:uncharacterized membrane protein YeaQ/YmgE (transglycosylase-associated protein family)